MSSKFHWTKNLFKSCARSKSDKAKRRPFRKARLCLEQLEVREVMNGAISLSGGALLLADAGAPTITLSYDSTNHNYTVTDNKGLTGAIPGWTILGNTATETDGLAGNITQLNFQTTDATFGSVGSSSVPAPIAITDTDIATINGPLATLSSLSISATNSVSIPGNLTVGSNFSVGGPGSSAATVFTLSGTNSVAGATEVISGALEADTPGSLSGYNTPGKITVDDNATLAVQFGGAGQFASTDVTTLLTDATFGVSGAATLGLDVTGSNTATYSSAITDATYNNPTGLLAVEKLGTGTLTLSGANSFSGGLTILAGAFIAGISSVDATTTPSTGAAGNDTVAIQLGAATTTTAALEAGAFTVANPIKLGAGALTVGNDGNADAATFSGPVNLNGNNLTIFATGTTGSATVSGAVSGTGNLVLQNATTGAGTITLGIPARIAPGLTPTSVNIDNTGTISNVGTSPGITTIGGFITAHVTGVYENTGSATASPLDLAGNNTFLNDGVTHFGLNILGGTVFASELSTALGAGAVTLGNTTGTVPAAVIISTSFLNFANPIKLAANASLSGVNGLTIGTTQAVVVGRPTDATATFSGGVTGANNLTINVAGNGNLFVTGAINNSGTITNDGTGGGSVLISSNIGSGVTGITESGTSYLVLSGNNANTGSVTITAGELSVGADANLGSTSGTPSSIVFNGGTLQITGATLTSAASGKIGSHPYSINSGTTAGFDIADPNNTFTISDALTQGAGGFTKLGAGTLVLTAANTYSGVTNIGGGTLQLGNGGATGTLNPLSTIVDNSTGGFGVVTTPGLFAIDRNNTVTQGTDFSGGGIGAVSLTGNTAISLSGNTTNHSTTVSGLASTAQLAPGMVVTGTGIPAGDTIATITSATSITLATAATRTRTSTLTFSLPGSGGIASSTTVSGLASTALLAPGMAVSGAGIPAGDTIYTINNATSITLTTAATAVANGVSLTFTETGGLANSGSGTTILTATNAYSGPTYVYNGVLQIGNGGANGSLGTGPVTVGSGNLVFDLSSTVTVPNVIQNLTTASSGGSAPDTHEANPGHDMVQTNPGTGLAVADSSINIHDYVNAAGQVIAYHWGATGSDRPGQVPVVAPFDPIAVQAVGTGVNATVGSGALFYLTTNESTQNTTATATTIPAVYTAGSTTVTLTSGTTASYGISIGQVVEGAGIVTVPGDANGSGGPGNGTNPTGTFITSVSANSFTLSVAPTASGTALLLPALANLQASGIGGVQIVSGGGNPATEPGAVPYTQADIGKILTVAQGQGTFSIGADNSLTPNPENYANPNVTPAQLRITQVTNGAITGVQLVTPGTYQPYAPVTVSDQTLLNPAFTGSVSGTTLTVTSFVSGTDAPFPYGSLFVGQTVSGGSVFTDIPYITALGSVPGTYVLSTGTPTLTGSISGTTLTVTAVSGGALAVGYTITGPGIAAGTTINAPLVVNPDGTGTYTVSVSQTIASESMTSSDIGDSFTAQAVTSFTGAISANTLTVSSPSGSPLVVGDTIIGTGIPIGTAITKQLTGAAGGAGTYQLATLTGTFLTVASESMTGQLNQTLTTATGAALPIESNMLSPALTQPTALDTSDQNGAPSGYGSGLGDEITSAYEMTSAHAFYTNITGDTTSGSNVINNVVNNTNTNLTVGFAIDGPGIPAGAIITAIASGGSSITLSQPALATATGQSFDAWNEWTSAFDPQTIATGGSGYTNGETVVALGGVTAAAGAPLLGTVTTNGAGAVTGFVASNAINDGFQGDAGDSDNWYSVLPTVPIPVTGGSGTGALFNLTMNDVLSTTGPTGINIATIVNGHAGSNYQVGDVLTVGAPAGITPVGTAATLTVTSVGAGGAITGVQVSSAGSYTAYNPATLFFVAPLPGGSTGSGCILSWQALQTSVPDNASSSNSPDAGIVNGGGYAVGDVLVVTTNSWKDSSGNTVNWTVAPILQVTHYSYSTSGASFTYNLVNTPVPSIAGDYPPSSATFNVFPLGYTPNTIVSGPNTYYGAGVNGGVGEFTAGATVNFGPQVFGETVGSVIQEGSGTTILTGADTYTGATTVSAGELLVDGSITSSSTVAAPATLGGMGTISAPVAVTGALIAGDTTAASTGSLTVGNLSFGSGGKLNVLLNGTSPGTGYDQVTGTGAINLTGSTLDLSLGSGFTPAPGSSYDILVNQGGSAITGTFSQGSSITVGGTTFSISYTGGSGHDVVLTTVNAPPALSGLPVVNGSNAMINIVSATGNGTTATITTDGTPHGFWVGEMVRLTGVTPGGPNGLAGTVTVTGVPSATTFQFASTYSGTETLTGATVTASLAGAQRSMVDSIVYNFTEAVNLTAAAFTITAIQNNPGSTVGIVPTVNVAAVPFTNEWVVTFTDPIHNSVEGHSIANGAYTIAINPAAVTAVSGGQNLSAGETDTFYRLYGDVTGVQSVKNVDANAFNRAWGNFYYTAGYNAALDYNDDGKFTNIDANAFNRAFNTRYSVATTI